MFGKHDKKLEDYGFDELLELKIKVDQLIKDKQGDELLSLRNRVTAAASAVGVSLTDLLGIRPTIVEHKVKKRRAAKSKYRHPENPELIWSGRGKPPTWLAELLSQGHSKDEYAIAP